jgi:hypothetical protein
MNIQAGSAVKVNNFNWGVSSDTRWMVMTLA